ncbi:SAM-dependent methyltransferase [Acidobacteriota bacterium]
MKDPSSFRDPSGFIFSHHNTLYRQINTVYKDNYDQIMNSGLYQALVEEDLLIPHEEADSSLKLSEEGHLIVKPEPIPFISYPYEWCFSQLKDAALVTLRIQKMALDYGMSLKDCSAFNIQFRKGKPVFIDTLSFEKYNEGQPWIAYRQFCQHFLAPLALMSYKDIRLSHLFKDFIDGIPLDLASSLLPFNTRFKFSLLLHIHLHAKSQKRFADEKGRSSKGKVSRQAFLGLIDTLNSAIKKLDWRAKKSEWADYYRELNYSDDALEHKKKTVRDFLCISRPNVAWDMGSNTGVFSRIAASEGILTISMDVDPLCVEMNYKDCVQRNEMSILPLLVDLNNPSPNIGWQNQERGALLARGPVDTVLALALVHHLAISNNVPLGAVADMFSQICRWLVIEFVPKKDSQVQRLLSTREDIFPDYTQEHFESAFLEYFSIQKSEKVQHSERILYLMKRN